jgi:hypothetical protein
MWDFILGEHFQAYTPNQAIIWYVNILEIFDHISPNTYVKERICMFLAGHSSVMPRKSTYSLSGCVQIQFKDKGTVKKANKC